MKRLSFSALFAILFASLLVTSCGDDNNDEDTKSPYVGSYLISKATLASDIEIPYVIAGEEKTFSIPKGAPFTELITNSLLGVIKDCSEDASYIEFRDDNSMYLTCGTTGWNLYAGIWKEEDNGKVIIMTFNQDAIPAAPDGGFTLKITNVELENGIMSSTTDKIPFPKKTGALIIAGAVERGFLPEGATLSENAPPIFWFTFDMEFKKVK